MLLLPIHMPSDVNWIAGVVNFKQRRLELYDSLGITRVTEMRVYISVHHRLKSSLIIVLDIAEMGRRSSPLVG